MFAGRYTGGRLGKARSPRIPVADDPLYYIRDQEKVVEEEDKAWAL